MVVSFGRDDKDFGPFILDAECTGSDPDVTMIRTKHKAGGTAVVSHPLQAFLYNLHQGYSDSSMLIGSAIMSLSGLYPTFCAEKNSSIFGHYLGIEFRIGDQVYI